MQFFLSAIPYSEFIHVGFFAQTVYPRAVKIIVSLSEIKKYFIFSQIFIYDKDKQLWDINNHCIKYLE